jgi:xanthine dehydrogenase accessory factor
MSELVLILETLLADAEAGRPAAFCAVVKTTGSTPQVPGAAMLVRSDFTTLGTLGGGCVEAEVRKAAFQLLQQGRSALLEFDLDHDYGWDDALICGGKMSIAVMPITRATDLQPFRQAVAFARKREPAQVPIVVNPDPKGDREGAEPAVERRAYHLHLEVPPTLLIAGAGHVGQALARLAVELDFYVIVIDDRADFAAPDRFPAGVECRVGNIAGMLRDYPIDGGCYVVIVTRGHQHDAEALEAVIRRPAGYIGMIGSKRKSGLILRDLAQAGVAAEQIERVHTPIGLPIGSLTVNEIAISILAELVQVRRRNTPKLVSY